MIALSICLFATRWVDSNKPVFFAIAIGVAMTFHSSAICFALLWFYKRFDVIKLLKIAIPASIVCLIFGRVIALIAVRALPQYAGYIGSKYDVEGGSYTMFMLLLFIAFIVLYALRNKSIFDKCPDVIRLSIFPLGLPCVFRALLILLVLWDELCPTTPSFNNSGSIFNDALLRKTRSHTKLIFCCTYFPCAIRKQPWFRCLALVIVLKILETIYKAFVGKNEENKRSNSY